jgi:DNA mismatch endonuclease (patch repair protein)
MDVLTKEQRTKNMKTIKSHGSKDEILLAKALWQRGYRYRKNDKTVFGKPDFTFKTWKIAIFVDSEYFHGKNWETEKLRIKSNRDFWWNKIEGNIRRDSIVNETLLNAGWTVLRFWSKDLKTKQDACLQIIENEIGRKKNARLQ